MDLSKADINDEGTDDIRILLPDVEVEIYIDESETEKLAEYQKHSWTGSTKDGFTAYMNSRAAMDESVKETMNNYAQLKETAEKSAIKQVESIAKAATGNKKSVIVDFKEKDDEEYR